MSRQASGLIAWTVQRVSAVYIACYLVFLLAWFLFLPTADHEAWLDRISSPLVSISLALFMLLLLMHAWVGIRDILMDYVKPLAVRVSLLALLAVWLLGLGLWSLWILLRVAGG